MNNIIKIPQRQVHLDFHTSPDIENIGVNFSKEKFQAALKEGNVVYIAHSLAKEYLDYGSLYHKRYFMLALNSVYDGGILKVENFGAQGRCTIIDQEDKQRYCLNLVYGSPIRRGIAEVIEDIMPLYNLKVHLKTDKKIKNVYLGLTGEKLMFKQTEEEITFVVPELNCHTSVVIEY